MRRAAALPAAAVIALVIVLLGTATAAARVISVRPGGVVHVVVPGFAARAPITLALVGFRSGRQRTHADLGGAAHVAYRAPRRTGNYTLLVVGVPGHASAPRVRSGHRHGDYQAVVVLVPRIVRVHFRVTGGLGTEGTGTHDPPGGDGGGSGAGGVGASGGGSGLADTGTDVAALLAAAAVSLVAGTGLVVAGRRTRRSPSGRRYVTGTG